MKLLFWNLGKNDSAALALECMQSNGVSVAAFAEYSRTEFSDEMLNDVGYRLVGKGGCDKIKVLVDNSVYDIDLYEESRFSVFVFEALEAKFIFATTHLVDRRSSPSPGKRVKQIGAMMDVIHGYENACGVDRTVIMGDFNSNPYDIELLQPSAFNAMLFKGILRARDSRTWDGEDYPFMYNPTVHWLSEDTETYGSIYYSSDDGTGPVWNCFDQALVSPELMDSVKGYSYLKKIGDMDLIAKWCPRREISDHLPLLVEIDIR